METINEDQLSINDYRKAVIFSDSDRDPFYNRVYHTAVSLPPRPREGTTEPSRTLPS